MNLESGIKTAAPTLLPRKQVSVDLPQLLLGIVEAVPAALLTSQTTAECAGNIVTGVLGSLDAITIDTPLPDRAWRLVYRSLGIAFAELATEASGIELASEETKLLLSELRNELESKDITLSDNFFRNPLSLPLVDIIVETIRKLSVSRGMSENSAKIYSSRFPAYFVASIHNEWIRGKKEYEPLLLATTSPFSTPTRALHEKVRYSAWLKKQVALPVFEESFSLKDIYVPLRGYYERESSTQVAPMGDEFGNGSRISPSTSSHNQAVDNTEDTPANVVVDVTSHFGEWLVHGDRNDTIRVLSGGPGSGKSSILKMLASDISDLEHIYPIYVPLQRISISDDLCLSVSRYLKESGLYNGDIFQDARDASGKVILFLDGLDELTKPGSSADTIAQDFLLEVQRSLNVANTVKLSMVAVLSGRTIAVQKSKNVLRLPKSSQFSVMRYAYMEDEIEEYYDPNELLNEDQRETWWKKYSSAKGFDSNIPSRLIQPDVSELSTEPLLNYLLVLSGYHLRPSEEASINRNEVYRSLLAGVHSRGYEDGRYQPTQALSDDEFELIMETIAIAAWYGDSRTASVEDIRRRCTTTKLKEIFERFVAGGGGVTRLIAAFYFQAASKSPAARSDEAFEFTHKSFGEYLTARRLVRALDRLAKELLEDQSERETPADESHALKSWAALSGAAPVDGDLARFIRDEIRMPTWKHRINDWMECASRMLSRSLSKGFVIESSAASNSLTVASISRNSEESLWCIAGACAAASSTPLKIVWPEDTSAGALLHRVRGQRWPDEDNVLLTSLSHMNFSDQNLVVQDLFSANLVGASFVNAKLIKSEMQNCELSVSDFSNASISDIDLSGSIFTNATFDAASGSRLLLERVLADSTSFRNVHFASSELSESDFDNCDFSDSYIYDAEMLECLMRRIIIDNVKWSEIDLSGSDLSEAKLTNSRFERVQFDGCNLNAAHIENCEFIDCSFVDTFMSRELALQLPPNVDLSSLATEGAYERTIGRSRTRRIRRLNRRMAS